MIYPDETLLIIKSVLFYHNYTNNVLQIDIRNKLRKIIFYTESIIFRKPISEKNARETKNTLYYDLFCVTLKLDDAIFAIPVFHIYHFINERLKKRSHSHSQRTLDKLVNELTKLAGFNDELIFDFALDNKVNKDNKGNINENIFTTAVSQLN
ncbi:unnamed protein product [Rhizophagus irregularis]|uniref:Uncharacterized protein n=1 Tax=Rhizophagus irregularis TaxID=588596 RepID=A0A915ZNE3_9GLOM|nr:unnamed protein product [Rhizophagus irregularis]